VEISFVAESGEETFASIFSVEFNRVSKKTAYLPQAGDF